MTSVDEQTSVGMSLPERAKALVPLVDQHGPAGDVNGVLSEEVIDAFHREGLESMWCPKELSGAELDAVSSLEVVEQISYADPSAGWVLMAHALQSATAGAYLGDDAVEQLFSGDRVPVIAGQGTRPGTLVRKDGGFLLSGSWSFASGVKHAGYTHSLAAVDGTQEMRICVVPVEKATLIDNWDVLGLRATASIDYTMDSVYVPESWTHVATQDTPLRGGGVLWLGIIGFVCIGHSGWALGVGRRLLDELRTLAQSKAGRPGAQADSDSFQQGYANAELKLRAARALLFETWADVQETIDRGDRVSVRQHTMMRGALTNATWTAQEIGTFAYLAGGTTALRDGTMQRVFRDLHAGTQHLTSSPPVIREIGRELAGLAPGKTWQFVQLVDPH
jgi:alkylation response protein AidB-like acyl-CoA dehydrogenase